MAGAVAFRFLPVAPLPQVDFPTISVDAGLPGASPETMASAVATPLERQFGRIAAVTQMTSSSSLGSTNVTLQFDLNRDINAAARDVQAAINAARGQLPADLPGQPWYRKVNPADAPILLLGLSSENIPRGEVYDAADSILAQKLSQVEGVGQVFVWGGARPAVRVDVNPNQLNAYGISLDQVRSVLFTANANRPKGTVEEGGSDWLLLRPDGVLQLDVRLTLKTDDGALIGMTYRGYRHGPAEVIDRLNRGEEVDPAGYYFRSAPFFETAAEKYAWLNRMVTVATGHRLPTGPIYHVFEVL